MKPKKVNGKLEEKINGDDYDAAIIVAATTNFDWNNPELVKKLEVSDGKKVVLKRLLPGERTFLVNKVLELSGYNDDIEEIEELSKSEAHERIQELLELKSEVY